MLEKSKEPDKLSDQLIEVITDEKRTPGERATASKNLYLRHSSWVAAQISKKIFNADDVEDIAQSVWMYILEPDRLSKRYTDRNGQFRSYLHAPIRWEVSKHFKQQPFVIDETGNKKSVESVGVTALVENNLDSRMLQEVIEEIIKPNLQKIEVGARNVYMITEHDTIHDVDPMIEEMAVINGISLLEARGLFSTASKRSSTAECSDEESCVYFPVEYSKLVDPEAMDQSAGRYMAAKIGITEVTYRHRLHKARKKLLEIVRAHIRPMEGAKWHE